MSRSKKTYAFLGLKTAHQMTQKCTSSRTSAVRKAPQTVFKRLLAGWHAGSTQTTGDEG